MQERLGFKQTDKQRLSEEAAKLRDEALRKSAGIERDRLIRRAQDTESASQLRMTCSRRNEPSIRLSMSICTSCGDSRLLQLVIRRTGEIP
jgi:hypothetical protein